MPSLRSLVPANKVEAVEKCLQSVFGTRELEEITLLTGGFSTALIYKIRVGDKAYVLRLIMQVTEFNDPARQFECMNIAAQAGVAPHVYYCDVENAVSLSDFVALAPFTGDSTQRMRELARLVRDIHQLPLFPPLGDFMDGMDGFVDSFQASRLLPEEATAPHLELYAQIQKHYRRHTPDLVSCHNDLNPSNRLYDGNKFWVVDWETAFRSDRYLDLATTFNFSGPEEDEMLFLEAYFGSEPTPHQRARFFLMRQVCYFFYGLSLMQAVVATRTPEFQPDPSMDGLPLGQFHAQLVTVERSLGSNEDRLIYAKALLNEALHHMRTARFADSIAQLISE